jgi:hypothetical protein
MNKCTGMTQNGHRFRSCVAALLVLAGSTAWAHHSTAMFDFRNEITLSGTVVEFQYTNPHSWLIVNVENEDGTVERWAFEADGPPFLIRRGISRTSVEPGMKVTVRTAPMKDGRPAGSWLEATLEDGTSLRP